MCFRQVGHWLWSELEKSAGVVDFVSISISFTCLVCALTIFAAIVPTHRSDEKRRLLLTVGVFLRVQRRHVSRSQVTMRIRRAGIEAPSLVGLSAQSLGQRLSHYRSKSRLEGLSTVDRISVLIF